MFTTLQYDPITFIVPVLSFHVLSNLLMKRGQFRRRLRLFSTNMVENNTLWVGMCVCIWQVWPNVKDFFFGKVPCTNFFALWQIVKCLGDMICDPPDYTENIPMGIHHAIMLCIAFWMTTQTQALGAVSLCVGIAEAGSVFYCLYCFIPVWKTYVIYIVAMIISNTAFATVLGICSWNYQEFGLSAMENFLLTTMGFGLVFGRFHGIFEAKKRMNQSVYFGKEKKRT